MTDTIRYSCYCDCGYYLGEPREDDDVGVYYLRYGCVTDGSHNCLTDGDDCEETTL